MPGPTKKSQSGFRRTPRDVQVPSWDDPMRRMVQGLSGTAWGGPPGNVANYRPLGQSIGRQWGMSANPYQMSGGQGWGQPSQPMLMYPMSGGSGWGVPSQGMPTYSQPVNGWNVNMANPWPTNTPMGYKDSQYGGWGNMGGKGLSPSNVGGGLGGTPTTGGGGAGGGGVQNQLTPGGQATGGGKFGPFASTDAWAAAFASEHGGRPPTEQDAMDALDSFEFVRQMGRAPTQQEWEMRYYTGNWFGQQVNNQQTPQTPIDNQMTRP